MKPIPFNRHILVSKEDIEKENESLVLVPEEYKEQEPFAMVRVIKQRKIAQESGIAVIA